MPASRDGFAVLGVITGAHGVRGEVKLKSFAQDPLAIRDYKPLLMGDSGKQVEILAIRTVKSGFVARLTGVTDRNQAEELKGTELKVPNADLPAPDEDEFYYSDLIGMQATNLVCLPENYQLKYYLCHGISFPIILHVAELDDGRIVGYVMAKMDEDNESSEELGGHITSISVHRNYRKLGIAQRLMKACLLEMKEVFAAHHCSLNVRVSNDGALGLYRDLLGFM